MIGEILGDRYLIEQELGRNIGRRTLLARDQQTQELVVVKLLLFGHDFDWESLKLFEREVRVLQTLDHPAIPRYLDNREIDLPQGKGFILVQSYIDAPSLEALVKSGKTFSEPEVKKIAKAILEILSYLHERNPPVIHRDLKPSNILVQRNTESSKSEIYLVDFGSVQTLAATAGGTLTVVGTYGYMPPEQFGGRATAASDLYSLGATLIYLVTGTHPADLPQQDLRIQFEPVTGVSPGFQQWLRQLTEPSLERRFASAKAALRALESPALFKAELAVRKPNSSKVLLKKNAKKLEIYIPPAGLSAKLGGIILFAIAWNSFIIFWSLGAAAIPIWPMKIVFLLFSLPFWGVGLGMIATILFSLLGTTHLQIDSQEIRLTYEILGLKIARPQPSRKADIGKVVLTPHTYRRDSDGDRIPVPPELIIWAGVRAYKLGGNDLLSQPELEWLASEVSHWLGMPLRQE